MKELSSAQIRQMYLDFFAQKGHDIMKSAPLVPQDDNFTLDQLWGRYDEKIF